MPIIFKKHFGDSDDDNDNNNGINAFLQDADPLSQPPTKRRKLNSKQSQSTQKASKNNKNKKTKSMLKRLRIKKTKEKNRNKNGENINKNKKPNSLKSIESMNSSEKAKEFQRIFLKTFKTTTKELEFEFKPSHFLSISRDIDPINNDIDIGSLDVLQNFLNNYYENTVNDDNENENMENKNDDTEKHKKNKNKNKNNKEWIAYTKSMQILIISPSVRKAVDTIKSIQKLRVKHSFVHKKHLEKMDAEQYEQYEQQKDGELAIIPLRVCELFGKHRKIEYQQKELLNKSWHIGVGGINRINKLCKSKHLTLKKCELIIIDLQKNAKNMSILDMHQMVKELCEWLKQYAFQRIKKKQTQIAFL